MLRCKIFSCICTHTWCYGIRNSLHEFDHGVWVDLFLCCCLFVLALQSSNKNRDVKRDQTFKHTANVEGYKIVMTTINLSVEIFTSMCYLLFLLWYCSLIYMYAFNASIFIPLGDSTCLSWGNSHWVQPSGVKARRWPFCGCWHGCREGSGGRLCKHSRACSHCPSQHRCLTSDWDKDLLLSNIKIIIPRRLKCTTSTMSDMC